MSLATLPAPEPLTPAVVRGWPRAVGRGIAGRLGPRHLLGHAVWSADAARDALCAYVVEHLGDPGRVVVVDETGFSKKGPHAAGPGTVPDQGLDEGRGAAAGGGAGSRHALRNQAAAGSVPCQADARRRAARGLGDTGYGYSRAAVVGWRIGSGTGSAPARVAREDAGTTGSAGSWLRRSMRIGGIICSSGSPARRWTTGSPTQPSLRRAATRGRWWPWPAAVGASSMPSRRPSRGWGWTAVRCAARTAGSSTRRSPYWRSCGRPTWIGYLHPQKKGPPTHSLVAFKGRAARLQPEPAGDSPPPVASGPVRAARGAVYPDLVALVAVPPVGGPRLPIAAGNTSDCNKCNCSTKHHRDLW